MAQLIQKQRQQSYSQLRRREAERFDMADITPQACGGRPDEDIEALLDSITAELDAQERLRRELGHASGIDQPE